jgi:alpha-ketoglutaric semialdehyde dehydrogenase
MTATLTSPLTPVSEQAAPTYLNLIGGQWVPAVSGQTFFSRNPANPADVVGKFPASDKADVDKAIDVAKKAFEQWRLVPAPKRGEILFKAGELFLARKEELSRELTREMGKVLAEARGDIQEVIDMTFYAAGEGRRLFGKTTPSELANKFAMTIRQPIGVVGLITPWNFPMAIPSWKVIPALIAGNAVIIKPASDTPLMTQRMVEILVEAGIPAGVLNLVHGAGSAVGNPLIDHPDVRVISFTGSCEVGRMVNERCAPQFKRVSLEMGGKNATIVMPDADLELATEGIIWGAFGTSGQRCTASSRVIVHEAVHAELRERLLKRMQTLKLGYGLEPGVDIGPVINEVAMNKILEYIQIGKGEATLLAGGERAVDAGPGWFIQPTLFDQVSPTARIAQEEIFGPVTALIPVKSLEHAIDVANGIAFGLSTAIYTKDVDSAFVAMRDLDAGITYVNAPTIGAEVHLPFGGTKHTGNGHREAAETCLDIFTEWKTLYVDYSGRLQRAQIDLG